MRKVLILLNLGLWIGTAIVPAQPPPYAIRTVAGLIPPSSDVPATEAILETPASVAAGPDGSFFIASLGRSMLHKVEPSGVIKDFVTLTLTDIKTDSAGNVFGVSSGTNRVYRITMTGDVTILAGDGQRGFGGDGGPAAAARFAFPTGIAVDREGAVYIADYANHRIRKITTDGMVRTIAGTGVSASTGDGGPATAAAVRSPGSVAVDPEGNVYLAESSSIRIRKISPAGIITTVVGNGTTGATRPGPALTTPLNGTVRLATAGARLYFAEESGSSIWRLDAGNVALVAGASRGFSGDGGPALSASMASLTGLDVDSAGRILVVDNSNGRIRRIVPGAIITTVAGIGHFRGDGSPATEAILFNPAQIAIRPNGEYYFADTSNHRVRRVRADGSISTIAGNGFNLFAGDGGPATSASLNYPTGVAVATDGTVYIAELFSRRIRRVRTNGVIDTYAGTGASSSNGDGGPARSATFRSIYDLALDAAGNLYVADLSSHVVRKIDAQGIISTVAGTGVSGFNGDGGLATAAQLANPRKLAFDKAGNLYIGENNRIRRLTPGGIISTVAGNGQSGLPADGGPAASPLFSPSALTVDAAGTVYFVSSSSVNALIGGKIWRLSGGSVLGFSGDGGPAGKALLRLPQGLAADPEGDILVADSQNHRIRKLIRNTVEKMEITAGDAQRGSVNALLPQALRVRVSGRAHVPVSGIPVRFTLESGLATLSAATANTDAAGNAGIGVTLGPEAGEIIIRAETAGAAPVRFTLTAVHDDTAATTIEPRIEESGVVSAGPNRIPALAPKALMLVRGEGFAPARLERRVIGGDLPEVLEGVCVEAGGQRALMRNVTASQLEWIAPDLAPGGSVQVEVITSCGSESPRRSNAVGVPVQPAIPEFLPNEDTTGPTYLVRVADAESGESLVSLRPAQRVIFHVLGITPESGIGIGIDFGESALPGEILSTGAVEGQPGVFQVECRLPVAVPSGNVPITLRASDILSPPGAFVLVVTP